MGSSSGHGPLLAAPNCGKLYLQKWLKYAGCGIQEEKGCKQMMVEVRSCRSVCAGDDYGRTGSDRGKVSSVGIGGRFRNMRMGKAENNYSRNE
jgi:hypothetical protein